MLDHAREILVVMFCRKLKVSEASAQRLGCFDGAEAHITVRAEARSRR
jgi:hypothetical protein